MQQHVSGLVDEVRALAPIVVAVAPWLTVYFVVLVVAMVS
jgi:hypothetical protein